MSIRDILIKENTEEIKKAELEMKRLISNIEVLQYQLRELDFSRKNLPVIAIFISFAFGFLFGIIVGIAA